MMKALRLRFDVWSLFECRWWWWEGRGLCLLGITTIFTVFSVIFCLRSDDHIKMMFLMEFLYFLKHFIPEINILIHSIITLLNPQIHWQNKVIVVLQCSWFEVVFTIVCKLCCRFVESISLRLLTYFYSSDIIRSFVQTTMLSLVKSVWSCFQNLNPKSMTGYNEWTLMSWERGEKEPNHSPEMYSYSIISACCLFLGQSYHLF